MNILDKFHHWRRRRRWNKQYRTGRWESLKSDIEAPRYEKIKEFIQTYGPKNPSILDLGCGDGVLTEKLQGMEYQFFKGIDFSKVSIEKAQEKAFPKAVFQNTDIIKFQPSQNYDIVIFNEVFYYIPDSEKIRVMDLIFQHLNPRGILISSIFREGIGCWEYFKENESLKELDFTTVTTSKETTYWKIGVYELS
ncbi:MAG: SAM-dependent methyltransferase [Alteromonas sp.]|nr:SAM-dependent methyltransferase [Alteromonas sp.]MAY23231.1 SAM-dependent methyltransferase [Flavobacteriaceae bacterium]|tara:strand:- start:57855 stop:58436 length:582 start_codon:yes stop_codon:yes gene_type:complete